MSIVSRLNYPESKIGRMFLAKYVFDDVPSNPGKGSGRSDSTGRSSPGLGVIELMRSKTGNPDFENSNPNLSLKSEYNPDFNFLIKS